MLTAHGLINRDADAEPDPRELFSLFRDESDPDELFLICNSPGEFEIPADEPAGLRPIAGPPHLGSEGPPQCSTPPTGNRRLPGP
jgi:hypothetical protein